MHWLSGSYCVQYDTIEAQAPLTILNPTLQKRQPSCPYARQLSTDRKHTLVGGVVLLFCCIV